MIFRLMATLAVAGTTCSLASASVASNINPKTAQRNFTQAQATSAGALQPVLIKGEASLTPQELAAQKLATQVAQKLARTGGVPNQLVQGGGQRRSNPTGSGGSLPLIGGDDCSSAVSISGVGSFAFDTTGATTGAQQQGCGGGCNSDVWFSWTAPSTGTATFTTCGGSGSDTVIAVWAGGGCGTSAIGCNDDTCGLQSSVNFGAIAGNTYMLQLGGFFSSPGAGNFTLSIGGGGGPANDDCSGATPVSGLGTFPFDTTGATSGAPAMTCGLGGSDVWYSWVAPSSGNCTFSLCAGSSSDSVIAAWAGSGCPSGSPLNCNDDFCFAFGPSQVVFPVTAGSSYMLQIGGYNGGVIGSGSFTLNITTPSTNDDCSLATVITGVGTFPFDNTIATTGPQQGLSCGAGTCNQDVWFSWTAPTSGICLFTLCNGGVGFDSLIAAYAGSGCPTAGSAIACNDDSCGLVSSTTFNVTAGSNYMLQLGAYAGGTGIGSFDLSVIQPPPPCTPWDDGSTENLLGWTAGGDMVWLSRFGAPGQQNTVNSLDIAWGSAMFPGYSTGNGTPTDVFLWQDGVTQDGDPSDATLVVSIPTTVSAVDTDTFVNYPIAPLSITGVFFVGSHLAHVAGQYVAPMDQTSHVFANVSYFFGDNTPGASANYANPGANIQPPFTFDSIGFPAQVLARVNCSTGPATYLCDPGTGGVIACPCSNPATGSGRGCDNSSATGGASISGSGSNTLATPTLAFTTAGEKPTATTILLQGNAVLASGVTFGQGVRCVGGVLKRLYVKTAVGGSVTAPDFGVGDVNIPARSATLGDPISAGQSRWYMAYYRDPTVLGGCSALSTFNSTDRKSVV